MLRLDEKFARIRAGAYRRPISSSPPPRIPKWGPACRASGRRASATARPTLRTRDEFIEAIEAVIKQDVVDIMLVSASNLERLVARDAFAGTGVKPAIRANDATDIWVVRGSPYATQAVAAVPHRLAVAGALGRGDAQSQRQDRADRPRPLFRHLQRRSRRRSRLARGFSAFRADAAANDFRYFLEVFNPNAGLIPPDVMPYFVNDSIVRCLAGLTEAERPRFLKVVYNGPRALDELASFDPSLVVGVLGGGAGTETRDCFELIFQAEKYGARVALFGRKINLAESPLDMVKLMRAVADGDAHAARGGQGLSRGLAAPGRHAGPRFRRRQRDHRGRAPAGLRVRRWPIVEAS